MHTWRSVPLLPVALTIGLGGMPASPAAPKPEPGVTVAPAKGSTPRRQQSLPSNRAADGRSPRSSPSTSQGRSADNATGITGFLAGTSADLLVYERLMERRVTTTVDGVRFVTGEVQGVPVVTTMCAGGKLNAARVTTTLIEKFQPAEVVLTGTAGALKTAVSPGDLFVVERTGFFDFGILGPQGFTSRPTLNAAGEAHPLFFTTDRRMLAAAAAVARDLTPAKKSGTAPRIVRGALVTGDTRIALKRHRDELAARTGGDAADGEAAAVAQVCTEEKLPYLIVRGISHRSGEQAADEHRRYGSVVAANSARFAVTVIRYFRGAGLTPDPKN